MIQGGGDSLRVIVAIQCRLSSNRLPAKALLKLSNTTVLGMTVSRSLAFGYPTFLLTSEEKDDDLLIRESELLSINGVIRGSLNNVLSRFILLTQSVDADFIVRVTADNPLTEFRFIDPLLKHMSKNNLSYTWVDPYQCAYGVNLEIFTPDFLRKSYNSDTSDFNKEHVTPWMRNSAGKKSYLDIQKNNLNPKGSEHLNFSIDTFQDFLRVENVINQTEKKGFKWLDKDFTFSCIQYALIQNINIPSKERIIHD